LTATSLYSNSPPNVPQNWGQINSNLNDYHVYSTEISTAIWISDETDWRQQHIKMNKQYTDLAIIVWGSMSIWQYGVGVEASLSLD
jgi:hypothetical protein